MLETCLWWKDFDIDAAIKECKRLNDENWNLKMKCRHLENYVKFKGLWEEFTEWILK